MDFARKQLEKYGWTEGKGLGKDESGSQEALKPKPKRGTGGVGHNIAEEYTNNWWQRIYDKAAGNIEVKTANNGETDKLSSKETDTFNIDTRKFVKAKKSKSSGSGSYLQTFVKRATLNGGEINEVVKKKDDSSDSEGDNEKLKPIPSVLSDEELFAACGGRTAHKGARHGLKSNGKLARIIEQEANLYNHMKRKLDDIKKISKTTDKTMKTKSHNLSEKEIDEDKLVEIKPSAETHLDEEKLQTENKISEKSKSKKKKRKYVEL